MLDFILYALAFGVVLSVVALCLEQLAAIRGAPRRMHWLLAMVCSVLLPPLLAMNARPQPVPGPTSAERTPVQPMPAVGVQPIFVPDILAPSLPAAGSAALAASGRGKFPEPSRGAVLLAWAAASVTLLLLLGGVALDLRRRASSWQRASIGELEVLVSSDTGPALIGSLRPRIVVPRWFLDEPADAQSLILQHERQHVVARDPLLLRAALLMALAMPWNLPLWWQLHRLRLAIELDCDARVMRSGTDPARYGQVLLGVTRRAARMPVGAVAMSEPASALEQRIRSLVPGARRHGRARMIVASLIAAAGVGAAAALEAPSLGAPQSTGASTSPADRTPQAVTSAPTADVPSTSPPAAATSAPGSAPRQPSQPTAEQLRLAFAMDAVIDERPSIDGQVNPAFGKPVCRITRDGIPTTATGQLLDPEAMETLEAIAENCRPVNVPGNEPAVAAIPPHLQERMRVVTGGLSDTYGSGAMAGVVNLVLDNRLAQRRQDAERKLGELRLRFNEKHPDVIAQKKLVDDLRAQESGRPWARPASNPMDLRALIDTMSGQWGWRFVIDPRVQGSADLGILDPNDPDSLTYHAFLEILGVHGFVAIRSGDVVNIVPSDYARSIATPTIRLASRELVHMGDDAEVVTALIPVEARDGGTVNPRQLAASLAPLVSPWGYLTESPDGKSLLMVDKVANVKRIAELAWSRTGKD